MEKIKTNDIIKNRYVTVKRNEVELPDGSIISNFYTVTIPDAVAVVAINNNNKVLLCILRLNGTANPR